MSDSLLATWNALSPEKRKAFAALMRKKGINVYAQLPVSRVERSGVLPLSYAQERMWFLAQLAPDSAAYNIAGGFELTGPLDADAVQEAVDLLVQRHEPLRSAFIHTDGRAEQVIIDAARCVVERVEMHGAGEQQLLQLAAAHAAKPFDLTRAPLMRVTLVALGQEHHALLFALHHIIADGWSLELLLAEFSELYALGAKAELPALPIQYVDYAAWQRAWLSAGELERQLKYWTEQLGSEHPVLELPLDKPRTGADSSRGAVFSFQVDAETSERLQRFAQGENATLFMLLLAAFEVLLYRWTGQADLRVGVPVSQRPRAELERLLGLFVNTHVHRAQLRGSDSTRALLARVRETALAAQAHAELPFERLVEALAPERNLTVNPLYQVMYNHDAGALKPALASLGGLRVVPLAAAGRAAQLDLVLETAFDDASGEINAVITYASELFAAETISTLATRYLSLLRQMLREPELPIALLTFLTQDEQRALLPTAAAPAPLAELVHTRIAAQAQLRPDAIALQGEAGEVMTYAELDRRANQWANRLRACLALGESPAERRAPVLAHAAITPAPAHDEPTPPLAHAAITPAPAHDEPTPPLAHAAITPAPAHDEPTPPLAHVAAPPTPAHDQPPFPLAHVAAPLAAAKRSPLLAHAAAPPAAAERSAPRLAHVAAPPARAHDESAPTPAPAAAHESAPGHAWAIAPARAARYEGWTSSIREESTIGILLDRSPRMLLAALAVWKAGAAFVALDPKLPRARLRDMLADAGVTVLLTERQQLTATELGIPQCLYLDDDVSYESGEAPACSLTPQHLAYLVYTSGSTGRPKAVAVEHGPLLQHVLAVGCDYGTRSDDCALHFAPMSFDVSIEQWVNPLVHGARLFIRGSELWSAERALEMLREHAITLLNAPPAYVRELAEHALAHAERLPVRVCITGGEALPRESAERIARALGSDGQLINAYGPTETVITPMTWHATAAVSSETAYAPIGRVVGPRSSYVLDTDLNLVPDRAVGELYLGGACLARGYLERPQLTAERFVPDPFATLPGCRMYRTGDLVRRMPSGELEYLGRLDHQVKLRGFRIELGEVEAALLAQPGVRDAVVVAHGGALATRLIGYVVGDVQSEPLALQLRASLPDYMVPSQVLVLDVLPRTDSGKVDRKRLPTPEAPAHRYVAPRDHNERVLSDIWREVLRLDSDVSVTANFFELGGDSIISIQVVSRARQAGLGLTPRHMFEHQTIEALAQVASSAAPLQIAQGHVSGRVALTPIQRELFARGLANPDHFNQAVLLRCKTRLEPARLERALSRLYLHHDALRMRYYREGEQWIQEYGEPTENTKALWVRSARDAAEIEQWCEQAQRSLSLARGDLLRALYIEVADGTTRLLLVAHHLVMDGVSFRILLDDLQRAYADEALPAKTSSFQAFSEALVVYASRAGELEYWQMTLDAPAPRLAANKSDDPRAIEHLELSFDRALTTQLLKHAGSAYRTQIQDLLLIALSRAAQPLLAARSVVVDLEGHGREDVFTGIDLSRTIGWFTSKYPVRLDGRGELPSAIKRVKQALRSVPQRGLGFGVLAQLGDDTQRAALAALPKPKIAFNYLGQFDASFDGAALFEVAEESHGAISGSDAEGDYWIDINGQVYAGQLSFGLTFNCAALSHEQRRSFVQAFDRELRELVAHCCTAVAFGRTPSDYPLAKLNQTQLDTIVTSAPGPEDIYPLTPMQRGMLFHTLYAPELATYVTQLDAVVSGLDCARFLAAWQRVLDRHAVLRTGFVWRGLPEPMQVVAPRVLLTAAVIDLRAEPDQAAALQQLRQAEHGRAFDIERAPLFRVALAQLDDARFVFIWTSHHLLLDGWSSARLLDEVLLAYLGRELPPIAGRFADYLGYLATRDPKQSEAMWRAKLELLEEPTRLASSLPPVQGDGSELHVHSQLAAADTAALAAFAQRERVTVNTLVQSAWALLLQRYTGQRAVVFGATVSGRPAELAGAEQMLGLFINTLPVIVSAAPEWTVRELIQRVQADNLQAREHEHTPLADIQRWAGLRGQGLFDSLLVFENYPVDKALESSWDGLAFEQVSARESTNYPLSIAVNLGSELHISYGFPSSAFAREQVERLARQLLALLAAFQEQPTKRLGELALSGDPPAQQLPAAAPSARLIAALSGQVDAPPTCESQPGPTLDAALSAHARGPLRDSALITEHAGLPTLDGALSAHARGPLRDRVALITEHERLTFAELEQLSDRLAQRLLRCGIVPEGVVGICMPRRAAYLVSVLAIWKAGGAFLPLDPHAPGERLSFMVADSAAKLVLTHSSAPQEIAGTRTLCVDRLLNEPDAAPSLPLPRRADEQLAYVIFTSGSTGTPKGVAVSHAAVSMHCHAVSERIYEISPEDCALHFASFSFDASIEQWAVSLLGGGTVRLSADEPWTADELARVLERDHVTIVYPPMSHMMQLAEALEARGQRREGLRVICVGGEAVPKRSIELLRKTLAPQLIVNGYGPTETVVTPLLWAARPDQPCETAYAPIGSVVGDRTCYVLDAELNVLPAFAAGELYIGGTGSARCYQRRPQLTAERFVPDPYAGRAGARMYRTGDRVRMLADGAIEYLGRTDHQVKLRGYRIELGEIEAALLTAAGVSEAYVMVHEQGPSKRLVGYVGGQVATVEGAQLKLLAALRERLPEHMVPQLLVLLPQLPRTRHGKVDRARLPAPEQEARRYQPPAGAKEQLLAELWSEILGVAQVGREDNFFELGGDSILSILVVSRARERGYALTPRLLFAHPVLSALAEQLSAAAGLTESARLALAPAESAGEVPLTPIQHLFFETQIHDRHHFNLSVLLRPTRRLAPRHVERALDALVAHHPALRFRYRVGPTQYYAAAARENHLLWQQDVDPEQIEPACQRAQRSLDLAEGPLVRGLLLNVSDGSQRLLLAAHHLATDGVSFRILIEDLQTALEQLEQGQAVSLAPSSLLFKTWAERLHAHASSAALADQLTHWEETLAGPFTELPSETSGAECSTRESCSIELSRELTGPLLKAAPSLFQAQVQDVILAALARALSHWTGARSHLVELEGHGRDAPFDDLDSTRCVGWFTRMYPMLLTAADTAAGTVQHTKQYREAMPDAGFGYALLRELAPAPIRARMRQLPTPRILFNYLGQLDATFDADGLLLPAAEPGGDEVSARAAHSHWLQLDAQVFEERFECTLQYDTGRFSRSHMTALLESFKQELTTLALQSSQHAAPFAVATSIPRDGREADDMALKPRQYSASPIIQLASGQLASPLFCMHPAGGVVFDYHILAKRLASRRSVFGIQCRTLIDPTWVDSSMEDMASAYMRLIVETQPEGPYHLLGWSFGADLAIETAYLLEQTGRRVAFLGLVDRLVQDDPETNAAQDEENDVLNMACGLLAARYPSFTRKELLLEAHGRRKRGEDDRSIVRVLVGKVTGASPDAQNSFDLEGLFVMHDVLRNMFRLSEGFALKALHVAPHCWWSSDAAKTREKTIRALEQGIGRASAAAFDVPSNHMQIVYDAAFVDSLAKVLGELEGNA